MDQTTESKLPTAPDSAEEPGPDYEYLRMQCTVTNNTNVTMTIVNAQLPWGKWVQIPTDVVANGGTMVFTSCGRDSSASGTEGYVQWGLAVPDLSASVGVTMSFDVPYGGSNSQSVSVQVGGGYTCTPVITGTQGSINYVGLTVSNLAPIPPSDEAA